MFSFLKPAPVLCVREALTADAEGLSGLHAQAFAAPWDAPAFEAMLADRSHIGHVLAERAPIGFAISRVVLDEAELLSIAIAAPMRGFGHAGQLLRAQATALARRGARRWFLEVESGNLAALALYRRFGFVEIGRRRGYYRKPDGASDALTMAATLSPPTAPPPLDG